MKRVVLDASAVMAFFEKRPGAAKVKELIAEVLEGKKELLMSVINWGEVYYSIWRSNGEAAAKEALRYIAQLPVEIVDADGELAKAAAEFRAQHKIPYADCFAAALARANKAAVITSDADFGPLRSVVPVEFL